MWITRSKRGPHVPFSELNNESWHTGLTVKCHVRLPASNSLHRVVDGRFNVNPEAQHLWVCKWQYLGANHSRDALLSITPPPQVRESGPMASSWRSSRRATGNHKGETPTLRCAIRRVKVGNGVGQVGFGRRDSLRSKIGKFGDLVSKHFFDRLLLQQDLSCSGGNAIVEQGG